MSESFRKAEVDDLHMPLRVEQQILGLQVAVSNATLIFMQELQDQNNLGGVELRPLLREAAVSPKVAKQFAAGDIVEQHI